MKKVEGIRQLMNNKKINVCTELQNALQMFPFFNVNGGCGVDLSRGESNCMSADGIWFRYCPFCGSKIIAEKLKDKDGSTYWNWKELSLAVR